ncbi:NUDIX domain-containing protein [Paenibacillus sp. SYP-B4298]|uniref:NUDIX domain-containing protein n=1 Tax=Paenibacillus sp. SYP-B4298 TaxID=2996034 RepID=UPI002FD860E2
MRAMKINLTSHNKIFTLWTLVFGLAFARHPAFAGRRDHNTLSEIGVRSIKSNTYKTIRKKGLLLSHIRVRCTGLIIEKECVLLVEYEDNGIHYNLPGGGLEPGETIKEGVAREVLEETTAKVTVGSLALTYEMAPHNQSGEYSNQEPHGLHLIFECKLKENSIPKLPNRPDPHQSAVKWVPIDELDSILLFPNIKKEIKAYVETKRNIELIEDHQLERQVF